MGFITIHFIVQSIVFIVSLDDNTQSIAYRWGVPLANVICSPFVWLLQEGGIELFTDDVFLHHTATDAFSRCWPLWLLANSVVWVIAIIVLGSVYRHMLCHQKHMKGRKMANDDTTSGS
jgi:hypothetical protein